MKEDEFEEQLDEPDVMLPEGEIQIDTPVTTGELPTSPEETPAEPPKKSKKKRVLKIVAIVLLVLINGTAATGSWYLHAHPKKSQTLTLTDQPINLAVDANGSQNKNPVQLQASAKTATTSTDVKTDHYISQSKNVEFDYPDDWRITASADDSVITINSAKFAYDFKGTTTVGELSITLEKQQKGIPTAFDAQNGDNVIVEAPTIIKYTNPTAIQRKETLLNISASSNTKDRTGTGAFISGSIKYTSGDKITSKDHSAIDPLISILVYAQCGTDGGCHYFNPGPINASLFDTVPSFQNGKKMIESLRFNK